MTRKKISRFASELEARQRNTVWPDTLRNNLLVDNFLWKGSPMQARFSGSDLLSLDYFSLALQFCSYALGALRQAPYC